MDISKSPTPRNFILGIVAITVLGILAILLNSLQVLSVVIRPFSKHAFRSVNCWVGDTWWSASVLLARFFYPIHIEYSGDQPLPGENAILLSNHRMMTDIPLLLDFTYNYRRLDNLKWFVKDSIKYMPGIGWGMYFMDCLFIKRNWDRDQSSIEKVFHRIITDKVPIWLVIFSEGTRATPSKIARSQSYAREKGLPILNHVLLPRTKGFVASVQGLGDHLQAIYDITIGYDPRPITVWEWVTGRHARFRLHMKRYPVAALPREANALSAWVMERFGEKDGMIASWKTKNYKI